MKKIADALLISKSFGIWLIDDLQQPVLWDPFKQRVERLRLHCFDGKVKRIAAASISFPDDIESAIVGNGVQNRVERFRKSLDAKAVWILNILIRNDILLDDGQM